MYLNTIIRTSSPSPNKAYHKLSEKGVAKVTNHVHKLDGTIVDASVAKRATVKCKRCKKRFNEDDIDSGDFIAELSICDPCLEEETSLE